MRQILFALGLLYISSVALPLYGQITITAEDMPASGDTVRLSRIIAPLGPNVAIRPDTTGENVYLDFTFLEPNTQELIRFVPGAQTPYGFAFGNLFGNRNSNLDFLSNLPNPPGGVGLQIGNVYDFYLPSPQEFVITARGIQLNGFPLPTQFVDKDEFYQFPLDYQDYDSTTFRYVADIPFVNGGYRSTGTRVNIVDGWGKVKLLTGEYDCIRVKSIVRAQDTLAIPEGILPVSVPPIPFAYVRTEIKWMAKGEKLPVFQYNSTVTELPGGGGAPPVTEIFYRDTVRLPQAAFASISTLSGCKPLTVTFNNQSKRAQGYLWRFGDGTTSTDENPTHTYTEGGKFNVTLIAVNQYGVDSIVVNNFVNVDPFKVNFNAQPTEAYVTNGTIEFKNQSVRLQPGVYEYLWDFGDGQTSTLEAPVHTYTTSGQFDVVLMGKAPNGCRDTLRQPRYITIMDIISRDKIQIGNLSLQISPNPTNGQLKLHLPDIATQQSMGKYNLSILDLNGKLVYSTPVIQATTIVNLPENLPAGYYILQVEGNHQSGATRFQLTR